MKLPLILIILALYLIFCSGCKTAPSIQFAPLITSDITIQDSANNNDLAPLK